MSSKYDRGFSDGFELAIEMGFDAAPTDKWQEVTVDPKGAGHTYRLKVPGGYLYRTVTYRFPEQHAMWEQARAEFGTGADLWLRTNMDWTAQQLREAIEIVAQNTTFVPEGE